MAAPTESTETSTFEQALTRLEAIVATLEDGQIGLAESLTRYEEGVGLLKQCSELLARAERRVELLCGVNAQGEPIAQPFDDAASHSPDAPAGERPTSERRARRAKAAPPPTPPAAAEDPDDDGPGRLF